MKKKSSQFDKFIKKKSNAAIKEGFRQEKKKWKKEREEYFNEKRRQSAVAGPQSTAQGKQPSILKPESTGDMPLNKFIAHSGICSRRDAAEMIKEAKVKVNGALITEPGHKVSGKDDVRVYGKKIFLAKNLVYILLNKPKDFITTTEDPQGRKTVLDLIKRATTERVYPVGRLDRNTSGVLLFTNDGELSQKLTHPSNEIRKVYAVTLDKPLDKKDFDQILKGVMLEDGAASVDKLAFTDTKDKTQLGVELHSGRNRIVRRIFEHLGYDVKQLDRVMFAGLTKKNVERGKWRYLNEKEVRELKYFGKGK
jgi:23S rRNA pseudouridine2605 synthase